MKTTNFIKTDADKCRRKIVVAEINILYNQIHRQGNYEKIEREMKKLHSLWFQGTAKDTRLAGLNYSWQGEEANYLQLAL